MRSIVRRSETQLGEFMLPALAMIVAPQACAEWEFVAIHRPEDRIAHIDPAALTWQYQCLGCGELYPRVAPLPIDANPICDACRTELADGTWEADPTPLGVEPVAMARSST